MTRFTIWIVITVVASSALVAGQRTVQDRSRQRPPEGFACAPNDLTSYTGVVTRFQRNTTRTSLRIRTDWDTTEDVTVTHAAAGPAAAFRFAGQPFTDRDWERLESSAGTLRPGTRATAWVCKDGQVLIDWGAPKEP
jgi:hypothetical protein